MSKKDEQWSERYKATTKAWNDAVSSYQSQDRTLLSDAELVASARLHLAKIDRHQHVATKDFGAHYAEIGNAYVSLARYPLDDFRELVRRFEAVTGCAPDDEPTEEQLEASGEPPIGIEERYRNTEPR